VIEPQHPKRSRDIKCFKCLRLGHIASKCLNKRFMVVHRKHGKLVSSDEAEIKVEDEHKEDFKLVEWDLLVV